MTQTKKIYILFIILILLFGSLSVIIISQSRMPVLDVVIDLEKSDGDYVLGGALLHVPGHRAPTYNVIIKENVLKISFYLDNIKYRSQFTSLNRPPTLNILLVDYEKMKYKSIIIPSVYALLINSGSFTNISWQDYERAMRTLQANPYALLEIGTLRISKNELKFLESMGLVTTVSKPEGLLPHPNLTIVPPLSCGFDYLIDPDLGIYYEKNWNHPAANQPPPQWFTDRYIQMNNMPPEYYWNKLVDRLIAAYYYVPSNVNLNEAILRIADWAMHPSDPYYRGGVAYISMEMFVGYNRWDDSLPPLVYTGWIPIFSYKVNNLVNTPDSENSLIFLLDVAGFSLTGTISGMMIGGIFVHTDSSSNIEGDLLSSETIAIDHEKYVAGLGQITSPGDYLVVDWHVVGTIRCGSSNYKIVAPRTVVVPFYSISIDFSTVEIFNYKPNTPPLATNPGVSVILDAYEYSPNTYHNLTYPIYELYIKKTNSGANMGFEAVLGMPALSFALSVFGTATDNPATSIMVDLIKTFIDSGVVNVNYSGGGAFIKLKIVEGEMPGGNYVISAINKVPRSLNGIDGIDSMSWGSVEITIAENQPPNCGPNYCPTNATMQNP